MTWEEGCSKWFLCTFKKWWQKSGRQKWFLCYYYCSINGDCHSGCDKCALYDKDSVVCCFEFSNIYFEIAKNKPDFNIIKKERKKLLDRLYKLMDKLITEEVDNERHIYIPKIL